MRKIIAAVLTCFALTSTVIADELVINENVPERYVVVKGDTLWDISAMFLADPWKWQEIWYNNPQVDNPHLIYPGDIIMLIMVDGQQRLTVVNRGEDSNTLTITPDMVDEDGVVKLRPQARITPIFGAIPAISRNHIKGFLSGNRILATDELKSAPYIVAGTESRLLLGAGDKIYARGTFEANLPSYQIYRIGERYHDPFTKERLGYEAIELGTAEMEVIEADIATFRLLRSSQEIAVEDRVLPSDESQLEAYFYPSEPPEGVDGAIVAVARGVEFIGQFDIILLNMGQREGIEAGDVFRINRAGDKIRDPVNRQRLKLPDEEGGLVMVFRTFEKMSYALVLTAKLPMRVGDRAVSPGF